MTKKSKKLKIILLAVALVLIVQLVGGIGMLAGGRAWTHGYSGMIELSAEVQEDGSFLLTVDRNEEDYGLGNIALERMVDTINEQQSLDVDIIAGATETSAAALACAERALKGAGVDPGQLEAGQREADDPLEYSCDVVVVGAGGAGLTAALTAARNGSEVIVVEKLGMAGGSTVRSGGMLLAAGTEQQNYNGVRDSGAALASYLYALCDETASVQNRIVTLAEHSADNLAFLESLGVQFSDSLFTGMGSSVRRVHLAVDPKGNGSGAAIVQALLAACEREGVQFVYNSEVYELTRDITGGITGVRARRPDGAELTVQAGATVLATGGYDRSDLLIREYNPAGALPAYAYSAPGNTGEGIRLAQQAGAQVFDGSLVAELYDFYAGSNNSGGLMVTPTGQRFADESRPAFWLGSAIQKAGFGYAWLITDAAGYKSSFANGLEQNTVVTADSIEALGQMINAVGLQSTVYNYNQACLAGRDDQYGKSADSLRAIGDGPYYAVRYTLKSYGTMGGVRTTTTGQAMSAIGNVPGLFACGEAANGSYMSGYYPGFGASLAQVIESGRATGLGASEYASENHGEQDFNIVLAGEEDEEDGRR